VSPIVDTLLMNPPDASDRPDRPGFVSEPALSYLEKKTALRNKHNQLDTHFTFTFTFIWSLKITYDISMIYFVLILYFTTGCCTLKFIVSQFVVPRLLHSAVLSHVSGCQCLCHVAWQRKFQLQSETCRIYKPEMRISPLNIWFPVMRMIEVNDGEVIRGRPSNRPVQASVLGAVTSTVNRNVGIVVYCRRRMAVLSIVFRKYLLLIC
jgi:hypothetical protein